MFCFTRSQLIVLYVLVGMAVAGMAVWALRSGVLGGPTEGVRFIETGMPNADSEAEVRQSPAEPPTIAVHVAGCVKKPGLYTLDIGARVSDAVAEAGGASPKADLDSINLAQKLEDGQQVYIAQKGTVPPPKASVIRGGRATASKAISSTDHKEGKSEPDKLKSPGQGTVSINTAGLSELQRLPGIGPAMAQRILDYRQEHGRFQSVDELNEVKGIGPKKLEKMKPFVTL